MIAGAALLELACSRGLRSIFVVGTAKNAGKTVTARAMVQAAPARGLTVALTSSGRDGESVDAVDAQAKPRLFLRAGTIIATASRLLPRHPAAEILDLTPWETPSGRVAVARVREAGFFEIAGPVTAAALRACIETLGEYGGEPVLVDGAVDRVAALAGGEDAVIIAAGASEARTRSDAVQSARALTARLRIPAWDPQRPHLHIEGALTASQAAQLASEKEMRQVVVLDPTRVAISGRALLGAMERLDLRCEHPLHPIAVTIASIGREASFEPRDFLREVAASTGLPVFDVYAGASAAA